MNKTNEKLTIVNSAIENDNIKNALKKDAVENTVLESDLDELKKLEAINEFQDEDIEEAIANGEIYAKFCAERKTA